MAEQRRRWDAIVDRVPHDRDIVGVELGVFRGTNSVRLLEALPNLTLYMVDRWSRYTEEERAILKKGRKLSRADQSFFDEALKEVVSATNPFINRAHILVRDTISAARLVPDMLDFVFVDAGHFYTAVMGDIEVWWPKIRPGGWMLGHDYDRRHKGLRRAVDETFPERELDEDTVWAVRKTE